MILFPAPSLSPSDTGLSRSCPSAFSRMLGIWPHWGSLREMGRSSRTSTVECLSKHHMWWWNFYHQFSCSILPNDSWWKIGKNCPIIDFDSSKQGSWCTECNAKKRNSVQTTIFEKNQERLLKNGLFNPKMRFLPVFGTISWFFQKWYFIKSFGFLRCIQCTKTLVLSYQNQQSDNFSNYSP